MAVAPADILVFSQALGPGLPVVILTDLGWGSAGGQPHLCTRHWPPATGHEQIDSRDVRVAQGWIG